MTLTSDEGCDSSLTVNNMIIIHPNPVANFTAQPDNNLTTGIIISFEDESENAVYWKWNFGDYSPDTVGENAKHSYSNPGNTLLSIL